MNCSDWSERELFRYFAYEMTPAEQANFERHISICSDCREEFELYFELQFHEATEEENNLVKQFLVSPQWQRRKEELARKFARKAIDSNIVTDQTSYYIPKSQWRAKDQQQQSATPITPATKPTPKISGKTLRVAQVAAVLLIALIPLVLTYFLLIKPSYLTNDATVKLTNTENLSKATLSARNFEQANSRLIYNPDDQEALFQRATASEELYLFEQAQADFQRYIALDTNTPRRHEAERRLILIRDRLIRPEHTTSRYDQLDNHLGEYLAARQAGNQATAQAAFTMSHTIAEQMEQATGDRFGIDAVRYYKAIPDSTVIPLLETRRQRIQIAQSKSGDNFSGYLQLAYKIKERLQQYDAHTEIELVDIQIARCLFLTNAFAQTEIFIGINLPRVVVKKHLFSQAQLLLFRGMNFNSMSDYTRGSEALEAAIRIATPLSVPQFITYPMFELATMHQGSNENEKAFDIAFAALTNTRQTNNRFRLIQLMQSLGISAFNLNYPALAKNYMETSGIIARQLNNSNMLALAEMFSGLIEAEQRHPLNAQQHFDAAFRAIDQLSDNRIRQRVEFYITGYYARAQMISGNVAKATELYSQTLQLGKTINIQGRLVLSQLHQGLGTCLLVQGNFKRAEIELNIAMELEREARVKSERSNALLTFSATNQSTEDQLRLLRQASDAATRN